MNFSLWRHSAYVHLHFCISVPSLDNLTLSYDVKTHKQTKTHATFGRFDNCHFLTQFRYLSQNYRESEYLFLYTSDDVGECCEYELSVLTQSSSDGYLSLRLYHHQPLKSYSLKQPGEMCASSLSRISNLDLGPLLGVGVFCYLIK